MGKGSGIEWTYHTQELCFLTTDEEAKIIDVTVDQTIEDARNCYDFLTQICVAWVDGLTMKERVQALSDDEEALENMLGFNPFLENVPVDDISHRA